MAADSTDRLLWRCVACRSENHVSLGSGPGGVRRGVTGPFETACAHCRTRHIIVGDPGDLARIAPRDAIGRRGVGGPARVLLGIGLAATGLFILCAGLYVIAQGAHQATQEGVVWAALGLGGLVMGVLMFRGRRGAEAFLACEKGLEVRGPDGRSRGLIPWEKIRGAEYRLLMGRRMALWLAVEGPDGSVPPAPLVAETGVALFTRSRAMPQFLMALAGRLGDRVRFILPIVALGPSGDGGGAALRSGLARRLVSGTLEGPELSERLFGAPDD